MSQQLSLSAFASIAAMALFALVAGNGSQGTAPGHGGLAAPSPLILID